MRIPDVNIVNKCDPKKIDYRSVNCLHSYRERSILPIITIVVYSITRDLQAKRDNTRPFPIAYRSQEPFLLLFFIFVAQCNGIDVFFKYSISLYFRPLGLIFVTFGELLEHFIMRFCR